MYVEQIIILNHCDWIRIEENIDTPPPKTPLFWGGLDTVDELIFGYVPRRLVKITLLPNFAFLARVESTLFHMVRAFMVQNFRSVYIVKFCVPHPEDLDWGGTSSLSL